jgi:hypothetical protein
MILQEHSIFKRFALLWSLFLFIYIVLRAVYVPVIHDELVSWQLYMKSGLFLPLEGYVDANNHVINSFLGYMASKIFPETAFTIRLANVFSLPLYLFFAFKISKMLESRFLRWLLFIALSSSDFILEFFALGRGYGISQAFLMIALFFGLQFCDSNKLKHILYSVVAVFFMLWSNLSLFNFSLILVAYQILVFGIYTKSTTAEKIFLALSILTLFIPTSLYALYLKNQGNLYLGEGGSFASNVLHSLGKLIFNTKGVESNIVFGIVSLTIFLTVGVQVSKSLKKTILINQHFFLTLLFFGNIFLMVAQHHILDVNYPVNRAALSVWFTLIIAFFFSLDAQKVLPQAKYTAILFLILPIQFLTKINLSYTKLWDYELISSSFYEIIEKANPSATIGGKNVQKHVWNFESRKQNTNINSLQIYSTENASNFDFLLIRNDSNLVIPTNFSLLECNSISDLCLYQNQKPATRTFLFDSTISHHFYEDEFIPLWVPVPDSFSGNGVYVEVDGFFKTEYSSSNVAFVVSKTSANGDIKYYNSLELVTISNILHNGEKLKTGLLLPKIDVNEKAGVYLWNSSKNVLELNKVYIRFYSISTEV